MAGYDYVRGMSNNAVKAHYKGLVTASKVGRGLPSFLIKKYVNEVEWHHTGSTFYNATNFYNKEEVLAVFGVEETEDFTFEEYRNLDAINDFKNYKKEQKEQKEQKVKGEFAIWGGTKKHPKIKYWKEFVGVLVGNWIILKDGNKKKANGNWIKYQTI